MIAKNEKDADKLRKELLHQGKSDFDMDRAKESVDAFQRELQDIATKDQVRLQSAFHTINTGIPTNEERIAAREKVKKKIAEGREFSP